MKRHQQIKTSLIVCLVFVSMSSFSQNTLNVTGNSAQINGMTFEYSIGEMTIISTDKVSNLIVTQGLLQPYSLGSEATEETTSNHFSDLTNQIKVYPNPTENILNVETFESIEGDFSYQLFDAAGKVVLSNSGTQKLGDNKFSLSLQAFASGNYYLMIQKPSQNGKQETYSFKIQKRN